MSKNQFTGTATQPQRNRNATANFVNLIMTSTALHLVLHLFCTTAVPIADVVDYHAGIIFIYTICFLRVILGQVRDLAPFDLV